MVDRIIDHLKLTFVAERPPLPHVVSLQFFLDSEAPDNYFFYDLFLDQADVWLVFGLFRPLCGR